MTRPSSVAMIRELTGMLAGKVAALRWAMGEERSAPARRHGWQPKPPWPGRRSRATIMRADLERLLGEVWGHALRLHCRARQARLG